ncbi:MAG: hypothetical protein JJ896_02340 [Rhodothermales bacterium]|nr:hypothetical protein [Rhodothermales bacterium]MBO6778469.1 hypothetical protein [Rhodothermales bacterium]
MRGLLAAALLLIFSADLALAQGVIDRNHVPSDERVDPFERRRDNIDGNNIRASITNYAQTAQTGDPGDFWYEWPKNTGRRYIALTQLFVGARVQDSQGDSLFIVDVPNFRTNPVDENISWTFEPIKGYVNPAGAELGIAQSDEFESWPPFWPDKLGDAGDPGWSGSWNGFFGKNVFNADQEFFYKVGDDQYNRYPNYFPDASDPTRKGMGIVAEVRTMAWSQILIDDVVFHIHGIKNDGTEDLGQVGLSMWLADLVGGDSQDDIPFFDLLEDVAFMTDADGVGDEFFGSDPVGQAVFAFLETPGNATDRIDNDADGSTEDDCDPAIGECNSPVVPESFLAGENPINGIDDNGNGLVDENRTHTPFIGEQASNVGVGYADRIDNDSDGESDGPVVTQEMVSQALSNAFLRWPPNPGMDAISTDSNGRPLVGLLGVDDGDVGLPFADGIDNDRSNETPTANYPLLSEPGSPVVTQEMVNQAASDPYGRYRVPGTDIILYQVGAEDLGKAYADGVDNDEDGAVDEGIDEGIDEMIDESRADGIDNDGDWNFLQDDVGLDGVGFSGDPGDGDGVPTTGAGTSFPGEKNIDITDISESDQIGITNVQIIPAFFLNLNSQTDRFLFNSFMIPGEFDENIPEPGENDIVVSSSLFPLKAGQTERISLAIILGITDDEVLGSRDKALQAYQEDYQFAQAPITPELSAVPGDGRVTLYWDSDAEDSFDNFLAGLGRNPNDFEGYRIYRSTDPAFLDALTITDGFGNALLRKPIAQFDKINGFADFHPVDVNGVKFFLGTNRRDEGEDATGLAHSYVDTDVTNGIQYFYAVTAYDFGSTIDNIPPTETPIRIQRLADGTIRTGRNVVAITPTAPVSGFVGADIVDLARVEGATSSRIGYSIIDPTVIDDGARYRVTFEDTLRLGGRNFPDTLTTRSYSLTNVTSGEVLIDRSNSFLGGKEFPIFDQEGDPIGFKLDFFLEPFIVLNKSASGWNREGIYPPTLEPYLSAGFLKGLRNPADYRVRIIGDGQGQSIELQVARRLTLPARPTNVEVVRVNPDGTETPVDYAFWDLTGPDFVSSTSTAPATFSTDPSVGESDLIILYERQVGKEDADKLVTWRIGMNFVFQDNDNPQQGDVMEVITRKPFLASDAFEFTTKAPGVDAVNPDSLLEQIRVVPNPYVVTNSFEPLNPFATGRGPRVIKFINLPPDATVRIFTLSGKQITTLRRDEGTNDGVMADPMSAAALLDGTLDWDLESDDGLTVAYGVYLYHVEAPGIGERTGTFAIIK